jgi:Zn-dependent M32 family carboxypeptidase
MEAKFQELTRRMSEINNLIRASAVLNLDQSTQMPPSGSPARARQLATLRQVAQEKLSHPEIGKLLDQLEPYEENLPYDSNEAGLLRLARREYERAIKIPAKLIGVSVRGIESIIRMVCIIHGTDYWRTGCTLDKLDIDKLSVSELNWFVMVGEIGC